MNIYVYLDLTSVIGEFSYFPAPHSNDTALTRPQDWKLFERVPDSDKWINPKDRVAKQGVHGRGKLIEVVLWEPRGAG